MNDSAARDADLARSASRIVLELTGSDSRAVERISHGLMTHKFAARIASGETYVIRFYPESRSQVVGYEPDVVRRCAEAGASVPQVLADSRTGPSASLAYMAYRMIEGSVLSECFSTLTSTDTRKLCEDLLETLSVIQRVEVTGYGELVSGSEGSSASWHDFITSSFSEGLDVIKKNLLLSPRLLRNVVAVADMVSALQIRGGNSLIYGDLGLGNIVVGNSNRLAGLIDFEGALAGDPLLTLGYCYAAHGEDLFFRSLLECWERRFGVIDWERVCVYSVLRVLRVAKYATGPLPTGHPRDPLVTVFPGLPLAVANLMNRWYPKEEAANE